MATTARARDLRYGRRGGNWLPELVDGQLPFGVVDGVRKTCPTPLFVRCGFCGGRWWVVPADAGKPCHVCGDVLAPVFIDPKAA